MTKKGNMVNCTSPFPRWVVRHGRRASRYAEFGSSAVETKFPGTALMVASDVARQFPSTSPTVVNQLGLGVVYVKSRLTDM